MIDSRSKTIGVPTILGSATATTPAPIQIIKQVPEDTLVEIRNNSFGAYVLVAFAASTLQSFPAEMDAYKILAGTSKTFVVRKYQGLWASSPGVNAEISIAISGPIPVDEALE